MKSSFFHKIVEVIKNPLLVFAFLFSKIGKGVSDVKYLKIMYFLRMGGGINLNNPKTFNEKLNWLKLYDRKPIYTTMVDKYSVKQYVADIIGEEYIIPTLGVWNNFDEIPFEEFPNQFVLKCTHDSGGLVICKDKSKLDMGKARVKINKALKSNFYLLYREWVYKDVPHRIIAEKYMEDESGELKDYKFFCFDGKVKFLFVASERFTNTGETKFDYFDENFSHLPFTHSHPNSTIGIKKPQSFEKMKELASKLSKGVPQLRVDFYEIRGKIFFGELTFYHQAGMVPFKPQKWDLIFGDMITLPNVKTNQ